jgi:signal transduction histidine kinase
MDITERILSEERLRHLNFELDSFIYKASHDLRAPLLSILGLINITGKSHLDVKENLALMKWSIRE